MKKKISEMITAHEINLTKQKKKKEKKRHLKFGICLPGTQPPP
jgi:hypothetical protein